MTKIRQIQMAVLTIYMMATSQAMAHGFKVEGDAFSLASVLMDALLEAYNANGEGDLAISPEGSIFISREDDFGYIECQTVEGTYSCLSIEKHNKPLRDLETYSLGKYMDYIGGLNSNARFIFDTLMNWQQVFGGFTVRETPSGAIIIERDFDERGEALSCKDDGEIYNCKFKIK